MGDWVRDIIEMHNKFGVTEWRNDLDNVRFFDEMLEFRLKFLEEELDETSRAVYEGDPEEVVDGLIDLCVVAIGTLELMGVNVNEAWDKVHACNMNKEPGINASRPNLFGLPDLIKPEGWTGPSHEGNHGLLTTWKEELRKRAEADDY